MVTEPLHDGPRGGHSQPGHQGVLGGGSDEPPLTATRPKKSTSTSAAPPLRVVVVEDEAIIAFEIEDILEDLGAEVVGTAASAEKAIELVESQRPDCVTMDISLQGPRDGIDAAREIYESFGIRAIFISAYGDANARARAEPAAPVGWIAKPIRTHELRTFLDLLRDGD